ncbi:MAG TPA: hypothetical protein VET25_09825 [Aestuariivirgaceae bacterium]|nr:hypothetical protein [Aestuariivirgaceae bacterium]
MSAPFVTPAEAGVQLETQKYELDSGFRWNDDVLRTARNPLDLFAARAI